MKNTNIVIKTKEKKYNLLIGSNILSKTGALIKNNLSNVKKIAVITDKSLPKIILKKLLSSIKNYDLNIYKIHSSEKIKNINTANYLINELFIFILSIPRNACTS